MKSLIRFLTVLTMFTTGALALSIPASAMESNQKTSLQSNSTHSTEILENSKKIKSYEDKLENHKQKLNSLAQFFEHFKNSNPNDVDKIAKLEVMKDFMETLFKLENSTLKDIHKKHKENCERDKKIAELEEKIKKTK